MWDIAGEIGGLQQVMAKGEQPAEIQIKGFKGLGLENKRLTELLNLFSLISTHHLSNIRERNKGLGPHYIRKTPSAKVRPFFVVENKKNPAYGRHQLSRPMRIIGPIQRGWTSKILLR